MINAFRSIVLLPCVLLLFMGVDNGPRLSAEEQGNAGHAGHRAKSVRLQLLGSQSR